MKWACVLLYSECLAIKPLEYVSQIVVVLLKIRRHQILIILRLMAVLLSEYVFMHKVKQSLFPNMQIPVNVPFIKKTLF